MIVPEIATFLDPTSKEWVPKKKYLDAIDCINDKYERQIERIIKRRDEQTSLYNLMISQERAKTQQGE